jgi:hypothetical protein
MTFNTFYSLLYKVLIESLHIFDGLMLFGKMWKHEIIIILKALIFIEEFEIFVLKCNNLLTKLNMKLNISFV